jgi:hypothetical protein
MAFSDFQQSGIPSRVYRFERRRGLPPQHQRHSMYFVWVLPSGTSHKHMSRIFEAIKHAEMVRTGKLEPRSPGEGAVEVPDRRRSRRWSLDIPVYVYGHGPTKEPFHELAHTLHVNANGALLLLSVPIKKGQTLLLTNTRTQQEQDCRVVFLGTKRSRTVEAGIEFPLTNPDFWQLPSAPKDESAG